MRYCKSGEDPRYEDDYDDHDFLITTQASFHRSSSDSDRSQTIQLDNANIVVSHQIIDINGSVGIPRPCESKRKERASGIYLGLGKFPLSSVRTFSRRQGFPPTVVSDCTITPDKPFPESFLPITMPLAKLPSANVGFGARTVAASRVAIELRKHAKAPPRRRVLIILP